LINIFNPYLLNFKDIHNKESFKIKKNMENFCQCIRERAEILGIELTISQQQRYNKYVNTRIEDGVHVNDALDFVYLQMRNEFGIDNVLTSDADVFNEKYSKINQEVCESKKIEKIDMVEKSNINYFIEKFDNKLKTLRIYHENVKAHVGHELPDDQNILFRAKEMIYIDVLNGLKIIKKHIENNSK